MNGCFSFSSSTISRQSRSDFEEHIFVARDRQAAHRMIESELFFGFTQQILKRRMLQGCLSSGIPWTLKKVVLLMSEPRENCGKLYLAKGKEGTVMSPIG
ncbi:hypothetical protein SDJN03_28808, partial [Cucurbita argyrosperma subsp. sororia]